MDQQLLEKLIALRHEIHQHPQLGFQEYQTRNRIIEFLKGIGIKEVKLLQPTALVVDLRGTLPPSGRDYCVAFRADMDALSMQENNHDLLYRSKKPNTAHMCGHDGHVTCLVAFAALFYQHLSQYPSNKCIRLLFQPSEEGPESGAKRMIEQGCLEAVNEVYGFHQWPSAPIGQLWCKPGPVMSEITILKITIYGTGGHSSEPETLNVAIWAAIQFYTRFKNYVDQLAKKRNFVCTLPIFNSGERYNVISYFAHMQGTIRSFQEGLSDLICQKIISLLEQYKKHGFQYKFSHVQNAPINNNTEQEANHVLRIGKTVFGEQNVGIGKLPFKASQDFAFFTKEKPGAFFFLSSAQHNPQPFIHCADFNFNDKLIQKAAEFWMKLAKDRLKSQK